MKLSNIIFEGFRKDVSIVNGEKYVTDWLGEADTLLDFQDALKRMPDTIESITVPINTTIFSSDNDYKEIKPEGSWRLEVYTIVQKVVEQHKEEGNTLEGIRISSHFTIGPNGADEHPIYVVVDTKESREFGDAMSRGDYGPLD